MADHARPCPDRAEQRSALLDGALSGAERDDLLAHLVSCLGCRADLAELRGVRARLQAADAATSGAADTDPDGLSARLVSIAGADAHQRLYTRPFTTPDRRLPPSRRRLRRGQTVATTMLVTSLAMAALLVGYVAAPASQAALDPAARARAEFGNALGSLPLASNAMSAVVLDERADRLRDQQGDGADVTGPAAKTGQALSRAGALAVLQRALQAVGALSLTGELYVGVGSGDDRVEARVGVVAQAGQGTELTIRTLAGSVVDEVFQPFSASDPAAELAALSQLTLSGRAGQAVVGRPATIVSADSADGASRSWWIDDATGLVLWQRAYDMNGTLQSESGFTSLVPDAGVFLAHLAPRLNVPCATVQVGPGELTGTGWQPPAAVAGLPLLRVLVDDATSPTVVHAVYGDGVTVVSVVQQIGRLQRGLAGYAQVELDTSTLMWTRGAAGTRLATWQSGGAVFSVTTTGSTHVLRAAVLALPRAAETGDSRLDRVRAGWTRILRLVLG